MISAKNIVNITGGIVATPERPTENIVKFRLAVDYAGNEKDSDNRSGYFDVVYFLNNDSPNVKFVKGQLEAGNLDKGSQIAIVGKLVQDRWTTDGKNASRVVIEAHAIDYAGSKPQAKEGAAPKAASAGSGADLPSSW